MKNWKQKFKESIKQDVQFILNDRESDKKIPNRYPFQGIKIERIRSILETILELRYLGHWESSLALRRILIEEMLRTIILKYSNNFSVNIGNNLKDEFYSLIKPTKKIKEWINSQLDHSIDSLHTFAHGLTFKRIESIKKKRNISVSAFQNRDNAGDMIFFTAQTDNKPSWYLMYRALQMDYFNFLSVEVMRSEKEYFRMVRNIYKKYLSDFPLPERLMESG